MKRRRGALSHLINESSGQSRARTSGARAKDRAILHKFLHFSVGHATTNCYVIKLGSWARTWDGIFDYNTQSRRLLSLQPFKTPSSSIPISSNVRLPALLANSTVVRHRDRPRPSLRTTREARCNSRITSPSSPRPRLRGRLMVAGAS